MFLYAENSDQKAKSFCPQTMVDIRIKSETVSAAFQNEFPGEEVGTRQTMYRTAKKSLMIPVLSKMHHEVADQ